MKKIILLAVVLTAAILGASAQNLSTSGTITASGSANSCTATSCVYFQLPSGSTWVTLQLSGTWSGSTKVYSITSATATYQSLNSQTWNQLAQESANGTFAVASGQATFLLIQASSLASGSIQVTMTSSSTGSPLQNPVLPGTITATGIQQNTGGAASTCWGTSGDVENCGFGPLNIPGSTGDVLYNSNQSLGAYSSVPVPQGGTGQTSVAGSSGQLLYNNSNTFGATNPTIGTGSQNASNTTATLSCYVNQNGTISVYPLTYGSGYTSAPTVTLTNVPSGASATVVANAPVSGRITGYTVSASAGWAGSIPISASSCPAKLTASAPATAPTFVPVLNPASGGTSLTSVIRVDDFGATGNGTTDDSAAINNAFQYAALLQTANNTLQPAVAFSAGKTYYIGSINGYYSGAFDDGSIPVAATLSCTASSGVVSSCSITSGGYDLYSNGMYTVLASGTTGSGASVSYTLTPCTSAACPIVAGDYVSAATVSGGTGYPNTFTMYLGPTCSGVPCTYLAPETPAQIGYGVLVPSHVTIQGNGATILGGFTNTVATQTSYSNAFPFIASFASPNGAESDVVSNLNFQNVFIAWGQMPQFSNFTNLGIDGAIGFQGYDSQTDTISNINTQCNDCTMSGPLVLVGGYWVTRGASISPETSFALNGWNIGDSLQVNNVISYGNAYTNNSVGQKALDCWFDQNFFHLEDQGSTNSLSCYTPPGGVTRTADQSWSLEFDDMWRGIWNTEIDIYTRYGRPTNSVTLNNIQSKFEANYQVIAGPSTANMLINNLGGEANGKCGSYVYGSAQCPNPYEPFQTSPPAGILIDSPISLTNAGSVSPIQTVATLPWQLGKSNGVSNFWFYAGTNTTQEVSTPQIVGSGLGKMYAPAPQPYSGTHPQQADSLAEQFKGINGSLFNNNWTLRDRDSLQPTNYPSIMDLSILNPSNGPQNENGAAYVKMPALAIDPNSIAEGQVTSLTITNGGSGYTPSSQVNCTIAQSTNTAVTLPNTTIPFTATCSALANQNGVISNLTLGNPGLGYLSAPAVTIAAPSSGTQATATATIEGMQKYIPVGEEYIASFYLPAGGTLPANSVTTISGIYCTGGGGPDAHFSNQQTNATLIAWGGTSHYAAVPAGLTVDATTNSTNGCTLTFTNRSSTAYAYQAGTASLPWQILIMGANTSGEQSAGYGPQGVYSSSPVVTSTALAAASLSGTTGSIGGSALALNACATGTATVTGVSSAMTISVTPVTDPNAATTQDYDWYGYMSAANTVTVKLCALVAGTPTATAFNVRVIQ